MKRAYLPLIAMGVGIFLIGLSSLWPSMTAKALWSEQQAREHSQAAAALHWLAHAHADGRHGGGETNHHPKADSLRAARDRYERSKAMLERARSYPQRIATALKWTGVLCALLGIMGYFVAARPGAG